MIDEGRKNWLRGAYQDRILESARAMATRIEDILREDFAGLPELSEDDRAYLVSETIDTVRREWSAASGYGASSAAVLRDLDPPIQRPTGHEQAYDPMRSTALGQRIDDDTWRLKGREQELLIEFGYYILDTVRGSVVKQEYLDKYINDELDGWGTYARVPLSESAREFLHGYVRELILNEYTRIKARQEAER
ncbi:MULTISPECIES: hypothetical protein [Rhizobium/Agrobacterium group]|uniref:hypothetical protein n=1 Tax=Rhizobium/Agrobacterium group TaxID=227290 RepID=UPI00045ABAD8|nr:MULTISPECIES: hypothetical protein [Rhizobium/Agrobacterium group]CAD7039488.1 hypothetical protein RP007_04801 [Rhizobium sp. P007]CDN95396.1 hypothetical protein BN949_04568 [Agrobacterium tumefaciens]